MRIMAISDLHGNLKGLNPSGADVVVLAGDIAPLKGRGVWLVNDQKKWINKKFREWTESYPDVQFVVTPGNHDFFPIAHILFKDQGIDWNFGFSDNVHFLGDRGVEINGVKFYGTPWVPIISYSWASSAIRVCSPVARFTIAGILPARRKRPAAPDPCSERTTAVSVI